MLHSGLIKAIHSGKCVALVGSGPSCEAGLPSWDQLVSSILQARLDRFSDEQREAVERMRSQREYARALGAIEGCIGRSELLSAARLELAGAVIKDSPIYRTLAKWPFAFYMTTNYDSILQRHLNDAGLYFPFASNDDGVLRAIDAGTKDIIVQLHGNLMGSRTVITQADYDNVMDSPAWRVYREKLSAILSMFHVVIVGHGLRDPDVELILKTAKDLSSPSKPIYMFTADMSSRDVTESYKEWNIVVHPYSTEEGSHRELGQVLAQYDVFMASRASWGAEIATSPSQRETVDAASLYLYANLNKADGRTEFMPRTYAAIILDGLWNCATHMRIEEILDQSSAGAAVRTRMLANSVILTQAVELLSSAGYVESDDQGRMVLTDTGRQSIDAERHRRELLIDGFRGQLELRIRQSDCSLSDAQVDQLRRCLEACIVDVFEQRGLDMAQSVFGVRKFGLSGNIAVLEAINKHHTKFASHNERVAFVTLASQVLVDPTDAERDYLETLSQGFFVYHALGQDRNCQYIRLDAARSTAWFLDSSVLISAIAEGCAIHDGAMYVIDKARSLGLKLYVTDSIMGEVVDHAAWAKQYFHSNLEQSIDFKLSASGGGGYRQNLFHQGYISWAVNRGTPSFGSYLDEIGASDTPSIKRQIEGLGVAVVATDGLPEPKVDLVVQREELVEDVISARKSRGTYKSDKQCLNEAEVLVLIRAIRSSTLGACPGCSDAYFVSHSGSLNTLSSDDRNVVWSPEAFLRFIAALSGGSASRSLYQMMMEDFYFAGVPLMDRAAFSSFFQPLIRQSQMTIKEQLPDYIRHMDAGHAAELERETSRVPELLAPEAAMSMTKKAQLIALQELEDAKKRLADAESRAKLTDKERKELDRLRKREERKKPARDRKRRKARSARRKGKSK